MLATHAPPLTAAMSPARRDSPRPTAIIRSTSGPRPKTSWPPTGIPITSPDGVPTRAADAVESSAVTSSHVPRPSSTPRPGRSVRPRDRAKVPPNSGMRNTRGGVGAVAAFGRCPPEAASRHETGPRPPDSGDSPPPLFAVFWEPSGARRTRARRAGGGRRPGTQLRRSSRLTGGTGVDYPAGLGSRSEPIWGDPAMPRPLSRPGPTRVIPCALRGRRRKVSGVCRMRGGRVAGRI